MSVIVGADIVPTLNNSELFVEADLNRLIGKELVEILEQADYRIFNLEVPLTNIESPIRKHGPSLIASTETVNAMKQMKVDLFALANNHIMDQGEQGLKSTISILDKNEIAHFGANMDLKGARKPYYFEIKGKRFGVYACAEHEFSIAGKYTPGANPFDPLESLDHVSEMKQHCEFAIVLYHGGKEHYRYPSPYLQKVCRKLVEKGSDLVICQHSHCIGCKEEYRGSTIVYGQGNFLFTKKDNEYWNSGLLIYIKENGQLEYIPICKKGSVIRKPESQEREQILKGFFERSEEIKREGFIENQYKKFAVESCPNYMLYFRGLSDNLLYRVLNKLSKQRLRKAITTQILKNKGLGFRNFIECEAHRELLIEALKEEGLE